MLVFGTKPETLPVSVELDATTGLPLLREQDAVMQIILAYLALPYSVTEHGCGDKANLIIDYLLSLDIPPYALSRGMILERDMSPGALAETDYRRREHALVADNPLHTLADIADDSLRDMLDRNLPHVTLRENQCLQAGPYLLHHSERIQFIHARSHIYVIVTFWDDERNRAVERVLNPSLHRSELFEVEQIRDRLRAPESLLLQAPLLGHFRLDEGRLTYLHRKAIREILGADQKISELSDAGHAELVRRLSGAEKGSIGDPDTWTYANNIRNDGGPLGEDGPYRQYLEERPFHTGRGDAYTEPLRRLIRARENRTGDAPAIAAELRHVTESIDIMRIVRLDASWSAQQLEPLADVAMIIVYYNALYKLAGTIRAGREIGTHLKDHATLQELRGLGVRLRRRVDWLANVSKTRDGRIDARALTPGFINATAETIRQMNRAGLTVFVDRVGNIHGLLLAEEARNALARGERSPADFTARSIAHVSHIDTVNDAGKFDGRLGVLSGIETAHVLSDLERYFGIAGAAGNHETCACTHVSAFIGEEMTFTGEGVSMPGSAAVAGRARPADVHAMKNGDGERFGDRLLDMLRILKRQQAEGRIDLFNDLANTTDDNLIAACSDPRIFFSRHTYERHIEQGPVLDRAGVPIVMVGTIMGIFQEDFFFEGVHAETAALEMNRRMRELTREERFADVRITVGILEPAGDSRPLENTLLASRWTFEGEMNHAGATPTADRHDPGVAAARAAREFRRWFMRAFPPESRDGLMPVACNVNMLPGTNRNVIPASVSMTLAVASSKAERESADPALQEDMRQTLEGFALGTLARQVAGGGEGLRLCRVDPVSYINICDNVRLSIDLRSDNQAVTDSFRERIDEILADIEQKFKVGIRGELQQKLPPFQLENSGQALLMERSYGGSHNPRETELLSDIVRGCILQIGVTREVLSMKDIDSLNLFRLVRGHIPKKWRDKLPLFTSGALHDTCNIAAASMEEERGKGGPSGLQGARGKK